jgi:hypothetical protein
MLPSKLPENCLQNLLAYTNRIRITACNVAESSPVISLRSFDLNSLLVFHEVLGTISVQK